MALAFIVLVACMEAAAAPVMDRFTALQVPAVSRCRNLIAGVISSIDLELYNKKAVQS